MARLNMQVGEHKIIRGEGTIVYSLTPKEKKFIHFENIEIDGEKIEKLNISFGNNTKVTSYEPFEKCEKTQTKEGALVYFQNLNELNGYKIKGNFHVALFENTNPESNKQSPTCQRLLAVGAKSIEEPTIDTSLLDME